MRNRDEFSEFDETDGVDPYASSEFGKEPEQSEQDMVPKSRFDEVVAQRNRSDLQRDEAIRGLLNARQNIVVQPQQPQAPAEHRRIELPDDVDRESADLMRPVLDKYFDEYSAQVAQTAAQLASQEAMNAIQNQYGAGLQQAQKQAGLELIDSRVPGFKDGLRNEVADLFNSLPPEERQKYDNEVGIEALAWRVKAEREQRGGSRQDFSDMAHSMHSGNQRSEPKGTQDDAWKLSDDEFEARYGV